LVRSQTADKMAAQLLNTLGKLGIGLAIGASVANTALYNGMSIIIYFIHV